MMSKKDDIILVQGKMRQNLSHAFSESWKIEINFVY